MHNRTIDTGSSIEPHLSGFHPPLCSHRRRSNIAVLVGLVALALAAPRLPAAGNPEDTAVHSPASAVSENGTPCPCKQNESGHSLSPVAFRIVSKGVNAAQKESLVERADTPAELEELWSRIAETRVPEPAPPEVDFERETLVGVFIGGRSTGGYSLEIEAVCRVLEGRPEGRSDGGSEDGTEGGGAQETADPDTDAAVHLCYTEYEPSEEAMVTMALTSPYVIVALERPARDIEVHGRKLTR